MTSISNSSSVRVILLLPYFKKISVLNANSVNPDQMPCSAACDLGLHNLPMSLLWDARHKWSFTVYHGCHRSTDFLWDLQICYGCFTQVSVLWPMTLLFAYYAFKDVCVRKLQFRVIK